MASSALLDLWERGGRLHPLDRNLLVVRATLPHISNENPANWPLGDINRALARLFSEHFGTNLEGWTACPECAEKLEFQMDTKAIVGRENSSAKQLISVNGRVFRLPTSRDLACSADEPDPTLAALRLLENCQVEGDLTIAQDLEEAGDQMAHADPLAEIRLGFNCPACKHEFEETLDLGAFIWTKIEARAKQLFHEVHTLASVYGWTEKEILSLSESRRSAYLQMVDA